MNRVIPLVLFCALLAACAAPQQRVALPSAPPPGEPGNVAGLRADQLRVAFGEPAFVRKDAGTELWRYDSAACKAFFFLYSDGGAMVVRHVETLPRGQDIAADSNCLSGLLLKKSVPVS